MPASSGYGKAQSGQFLPQPCPTLLYRDRCVRKFAAFGVVLAQSVEMPGPLRLVSHRSFAEPTVIGT